MCIYHLIFICRLLNPKVVHACTLVLTDWEDIPTAALKAAVTILHRIAVGSKMPALLFQVSIQRKVLNMKVLNMTLIIKQYSRQSA